MRTETEVREKATELRLTLPQQSASVVVRNVAEMEFL
jgi:hypothetical protein